MRPESKSSLLNISRASATPAGHNTVHRRAVYAIESWLLKRLMSVIGNPAIRVELWDGREHYRCPSSSPVAGVRLTLPCTLRRLLTNPTLHFGDDYSNGSIQVEGDLVTLLEAIANARLETTRPRWLNDLVTRGLTPQRRNDREGARSNIHQHYDIGNDFYALWLDSSLAYTCAYFPTPDATLETAQTAKMDLVCRKLRLRPGERVVEAGCGWGALARHMARHYGVTVRAYNISHEQIVYARDRASREGLRDRVEYVEDDYRTITGNYDAFVSVGMLEHVGLDHYADLGDVIDRALTTEGRGLLHSIGQLQPEPTCAWTRERLFPGGYSPTLKQMLAVLERPGFSVLDVENLRLHYARTVEHWLARYDASADTVGDAFDPFFVRAWRLYLAGCIANFHSGSLQLYQVLFARPTLNGLPWTRDDLYATGDGPVRTGVPTATRPSADRYGPPSDSAMPPTTRRRGSWV